MDDSKVIRKLGLQNVLDVDQTAEATGISDAIAYEIPYFDVNGKPIKYSRWKLIPLGGDLPFKYYQEPKTIPHLYLSPLTDWSKIKDNVSERIVLTEGEKKASCGCLFGIPTIGLGGVWNWKSRKWNMDLLPEFSDFKWQGREVEICFDGDLSSNVNVARAMGALTNAMAEMGCRVFVRRLPNVDGKTGMDDYLVEYGAEEYLDLPCDEDDASLELHRINEDLMYVTDMLCFFSLNDNIFYPNAQKLHPKYGHLKIPGPDGKKLSAIKIWVEWSHRREVAGITYDPGEPMFVNNKFNTWRAGPLPKRGKVNQFLEVVSKAGDQTFQDWFLQWLAYPLVHQGTKLLSAVLVWSLQHGTGKTFIGELMKRVYGEHNSETIADVDLHDERYGWIRNKQFILAEEVTQGGRRQDMSLIKHLITGKVVRVNEKYVPAYSLPNRANFYFTSNDPTSMRLDRDDRRMGVGQFTEKLPDSFWREMDAWAKDGDEAPMAILWYLKNKVSLKGFNPNAKAPDTSDKEAMHYASLTAMEQWAEDLLNDADSALPKTVREAVAGKDVFTASDLLSCVPEEILKSSGGVTSLGKALVRAGAVRMKPVRTDKGLKRMLAIRNVDFWKSRLQDPASWAANYAGKMSVGAETKRRRKK